MADYKKMYTLMCGAVSSSLDVLSENMDVDSVNWVRFFLEQAMLRAEHIYITTENDIYDEEI